MGEVRTNLPIRYAQMSAYWFASSFKWFALLTVTLPQQVSLLVPEGTKNTAWGMVFALGALWAVIGPSLFGAMSDRSARRAPFILAGAGLTILAVAFLATADALWKIAVGYLVLQVADDVGTGPYGALIPEHVPKDRRGRASGVISLLSLCGQLAAAPAVLLSGGNPKLVYGLIGLAATVCAFIAYRAIVPLEANRVSQPRGPFLKDFLAGWKAPWRHRDFVWVWFSRLMFSLGLYLTQPYLRNYLQDVVRAFSIGSWTLPGVDQATAVLALLITLFAAIGSVVGGGMADRVGRKAVVLRGGGVMAASLIPFLLLHQFTALLLIGLVFGLGYGIYLSADWALASDVMPDTQSLGRDMGIWQMSVSSVQIFAGSAGRIVDWGNGQSPGLGYRITFGLSVVAFAIGILAVRKVRTTL